MMRNTRKIRSIVVSTCAAVLTLSAPFSNAHSQQTASCIKERGQLVLFPAISKYTSHGYYDDAGNSQRYADNGVFTRMQTSIYAEYGITAKFEVLGSAGISRLRSATDRSSIENVAFNNPEIGIQADITSVPILSRFFCALSVTAKLPYRSGGEPLVGYAQTDVEARLRAVGWVDVFGHHGFWVLDAAARRRFGPPGDLAKVEALTAIDLTHQLAVVMQVYATHALGSATPAEITSNPNLFPAYSSVLPQVGLLYRFIPGLRAQLSWSRELAGRNAGNGQTITLLWWLGA